MTQKRFLADLEGEEKPHSIDVLLTIREYAEESYPIDAERTIAIIEKAELPDIDLSILADYITENQNNSIGRTGRTQKQYMIILNYLRSFNLF